VKRKQWDIALNKYQVMHHKKLQWIVNVIMNEHTVWKKTLAVKSFGEFDD